MSLFFSWWKNWGKVTKAYQNGNLVTGMVLSIACTAVFILTRQPYAGIICLAILVVKGSLIGEGKSFHSGSDERRAIIKGGRV